MKHTRKRKALQAIGEFATFAVMITAVTVMCLTQLDKDGQAFAAPKESEPIHTISTHYNKPEADEVVRNELIPETTEKPIQTNTEPEIIVLDEESRPIRFDCPLDGDLQDHIVRICEEHNIDPAIIIAMAERESTYRADAIGDNGNSFGLCQIQIKWHRNRMDRLGVTDLLDPYQNVTVAVDYLAEMLDWYDGDMAKALTAYNQGSYKGVVSKYAKGIIAAAEEMAVIE